MECQIMKHNHDFPCRTISFTALRIGRSRLLLSMRWLLPILALVLATAPPLPAQTAGDGEPGAIEGRVTTLEGEPVKGAGVALADLRQRTITGADGTFRFDAVPPGSHLLEVESATGGSAVERVTVDSGATAEVEITITLVRHEDEIMVTGSPILRSQLEIAQPTSVLTGEELLYRRQPSLGETLAQEPGVTSTFFGPGASRPVIRGLGGDRIRILQGGIDTGDVAGTSPDHAVTADPAAAERIEVLRGPATLLYGSSAIGGVVNVIDGRIPDFRPEEPVTGSVELRAGSVDDERSGTVQLGGGAGDWAWHVDALARETGDYEIPGFAAIEEDEHGDEEHEEEEENPFGVVPNSDLETAAGSFGVTRFFGDAGFLGVSASGFESEYGVPGSGHGHGEGEEGEEGGDVRIDLERRRLDLRSEVGLPFGPFQGVKTRIGYVDYEHAELEGADGEVGTRFFNDSWEGRFELVQKPRGSVSGSVGVQLGTRDLEAVGDEAFIPATEARQLALFAFEEIDRGAFRWQLGARYESQEVDATDPVLQDRSFDAVSGSVGIVWLPVDGYSLGLSVARSTKLPNPEELYSDGPHFATQAFEVGDPELGEETSVGADLSLRKTSGRLRGSLSFFVNRFDDFIYQSFTGAVEDGLPVLAYTQDDTELTGFELDGRYSLWESGSSHLDLSFQWDRVRAELRDTGEPLPRIPPQSFGVGVHYHTTRWHAFAELRRSDEQDRVAENETATDGYTLVNAGTSYRFFWSDQVFDLLLRGRNLTDEEARNHVSFLKDRVPLPGRDVSLSLRWTF
jgi:iron complex outermembrane receptor protein